MFHAQLTRQAVEGLQAEAPVRGGDRDVDEPVVARRRPVEEIRSHPLRASRLDLRPRDRLADGIDHHAGQGRECLRHDGDREDGGEGPARVNPHGARS